MKRFIGVIIVVLVNFVCDLSAQCSAPVNFQNPKNIAAVSPGFQHYLTARRDSASGRPYLYIAAKEAGLIIQNISNISNPLLLSSVPVSSLSNLDVISITQSGNYLYLALGDIFSATAQKSGMAIIDISVPAAPLVKSVYTFTANSGAGCVFVEGNYAYLAAMQNGILVLDVSNPSSVQFVSQFKPAVNFPVNNPSSSDQLKINARSLVVRNNIGYLCYDAGGVRIINTSNKGALKETGRYSNPLLNSRPRAYNNLILDDTLVYVAADYCGMEVLNVKDTAHVNKIGWWNPWKCETPSNNWFNSPGHTNEIVYDRNCKTVFMSAGRTDLLAVNVSNPALPDSCSQFGLKADSSGTWGLGMYQDKIFLGYISTWPLYIPFRSEWSGIKIVTYNNVCATAISEYEKQNRVRVFPNPAQTELRVECPSCESGAQLLVRNLQGMVIYKQNIRNENGAFKLNVQQFEEGVYLGSIQQEGAVLYFRFTVIESS